MKAVLDTCVLYPTVMREVLLAAAESGFFSPIWSDRICEEWALAARKYGHEEVARAEIALFKWRWMDGQFEARHSDLARLHLPDHNDIHILASAISGSADGIVTANSKDFPRHTLAEEGRSRWDPDAFLLSFYNI